MPESDADENGVAAPRHPRRAAAGPAVAAAGTPTTSRSRPREELEEAHHHAEHEHELEAGLDHPAAGHEFDDHALRDADGRHPSAQH